ncbi:hypothetical protein ACA910_014111 [Epithemia clementina (nom. ined.)]
MESLCSLKRLFLLFFFISLKQAIAGELSSGVDAVEYIKSNVAKEDVMVFAKSYCPFCRKTRLLLESLHEEIEGWSLEILDIDLLEGSDGSVIQQALMELTGQRTVPNVFIGGAHIGGNSELQELHQQGHLVPLLQERAGRALHDEV